MTAPWYIFSFDLRELGTFATTAKYAGVSLTSALAIYGITHEFKEGPEAHKKLTAAGRKAILTSILLGLITILGTKMDADLQAQKAQEDAQNLRAIYSHQTRELADVYTRAKGDLEISLRRQYQQGRQELEDSLKPVDTLDIFLIFHFTESLSRSLPSSDIAWQDSGVPMFWHFVGRQFFGPMLGFRDPESKNTYRSSLLVEVSDDPFLSLWFSGCKQWEDTMCAADGRFLTNSFPTESAEKADIGLVRYGGDPKRARLYVQFRIEHEQLSKFKTDRPFIVRDFLLPRHGFTPSMTVILAERPIEPPQGELDKISNRLPSEVKLQVRVNEDIKRLRKYTFVKSPSPMHLNSSNGELSPVYLSQKE